MRRGLRALLAGTMVGASVLWLPPGAGAAAQFEGVASADGVRIGVVAPGFSLMDQLVEVAGPTTQALVDSFGNSRGFASNPYPGELIVTTPGTLAALGPPQIPHLPDYPFLAQTSWPTASKAEARHGTLVLLAESEELASEASASAGAAIDDPAIAATRATADVRRAADGTVTSAAASVAEGVRVGPLSIAEIRAHAKVTRPAGGSPRRESALAVTGLRVDGQALALTEEGLSLPGSTVPLPSTDPLLEPLAEAGIGIRVLRSESNPDGIVAPGVQITSPQTIPGMGDVTLQYVFGRASAHAEAAALPVPSPTVFLDTPPPASGGGEQITGPGGAFVAGEQFTAPPDAPAAPRPVRPSALAAAGRSPLQSAASIYVVLVVAGVVAVAGFQVVRVLGVRSGWTS